MMQLIMAPLLALTLTAPAGPCACGPGLFCTWTGPEFTGSHDEHPPATHEYSGQTTVTRSMMNRSVQTIRVSGTVSGAARGYCLNPTDSVGDTGADFLITKVTAGPAPC